MASHMEFEEYLKQVGMEHALQKIELDEGEEIVIKGKSEGGVYKGPGTVFMGYYPN